MTSEIASLPHATAVETPPSLAEAMVRSIGDNARARWLDPCCGRGSLVRAVSTLQVPRSRLTAIDLGHVPPALALTAEVHDNTDFLAWTTTRKPAFDKIVANPPFIAISKLPAVLQNAAVNERRNGFKIDRTANYWMAFLGASLEVLRPGGDVCFVLPAAWEFANFADEARSAIPTMFSTFETHRSRGPLFEDVSDGCVVVVGRDYLRPRIRPPARYVHASPRDLIAAVGLGGPKHRTVARPARPTPPEAHPQSVDLGDVMDIRIGGVTGQVGYFLLTDTSRVKHALPDSALQPVLSRAAHLNSSHVTSEEWETLRRNLDRVWLFSPSDELVANEAVRNYLALDRASGGCDRSRYKIARRTPWFRTPMPPQVDCFISGMSRNGPWLALNSMPGLSATNTLYVGSFRANVSPRDRFVIALSLLGSDARSYLEKRTRHYGDGLLKVEPGDLARAPVLPTSFEPSSADTYRECVSALLDGKEEECREMADQWCLLHCSS